MKKATEIEPDEALNYDRQAVTYAALGLYEDSVDKSVQAIAMDDGVAQYHYSKGIASYYSESYPTALDELDTAIAKQPKRGAYHAILGAIRVKMEDYEGALENFQRAIELEPSNALYYYSLGVTLDKMNLQDERNAEF